MHKAIPAITNIDVSKLYDDRYAASDVHYESFSRMADFFGRDMPPHHHDCFFQIHFLETGKIELQLEDQRYSVNAPLLVLTPPGVPHTFFTESDSDGHVLTVRQEIVWPVLSQLYPGTPQALDISGVCLSLAGREKEVSQLQHYWSLIEHEYQNRQTGWELSVNHLAQAMFVSLFRYLSLKDVSVCRLRGEQRLFGQFTQLMEKHYSQHWSVSDYAKALCITESRLTDLCRRFANQSPKRLIAERTLREAKRLLLFGTCSVHEIGYQLGFKDPAYFSRFFNRMAGCTPTHYRNSQSAYLKH